jgi:hypothetical protein
MAEVEGWVGILVTSLAAVKRRCLGCREKGRKHKEGHERKRSSMPQRRRMGACRTFCHGPATNETVDASAFPTCGTYGGLVRREAGQHFFFSGTHGGRVRK